MKCLFFKKNFLFWISIDLEEVAKNVQGSSGYPWASSLNDNILLNYIVQWEYQEIDIGTTQEAYSDFTSIVCVCACVFVCVCVVLWHFSHVQISVTTTTSRYRAVPSPQGSLVLYPLSPSPTLTTHKDSEASLQDIWKGKFIVAVIKPDSTGWCEKWEDANSHLFPKDKLLFYIWL